MSNFFITTVISKIPCMRGWVSGRGKVGGVGRWAVRDRLYFPIAECGAQ